MEGSKERRDFYDCWKRRKKQAVVVRVEVLSCQCDFVKLTGATCSVHLTAWVRCIHSLWMWRCCLLPCTQLKDLIHPDENPMYTLYCYRFSCRSVQQCFWESIAKLVDGFWILTTLFAAFRNCRSVRSNFTAQAHLCFPLSDDPVNRETSQGKPGKYHTWVGRQKCDGQKSPKSVFTGFANELPKASRWRF